MRATMIYSKSAEASVKRIVDLAIMGADFRNTDRIDFEKENYLKELIRISSNNTIAVNGLADKVQFFFIKGGAEGFFDNTYTGIDASRITRQGATTAGGASDVFVFDDTCLLAVFDPRGKLISSALVSRPISITGIWTEKTANAVLDARQHTLDMLFALALARMPLRYRPHHGHRVVGECPVDQGPLEPALPIPLLFLSKGCELLGGQRDRLGKLPLGWVIRDLKLRRARFRLAHGSSSIVVFI